METRLPPHTHEIEGTRKMKREAVKPPASGAREEEQGTQDELQRNIQIQLAAAASARIEAERLLARFIRQADAAGNGGDPEVLSFIAKAGQELGGSWHPSVTESQKRTKEKAREYSIEERVGRSEEAFREWFSFNRAEVSSEMYHFKRKEFNTRVAQAGIADTRFFSAYQKFQELRQALGADDQQQVESLMSWFSGRDGTGGELGQILRSIDRRVQDEFARTGAQPRSEIPEVPLEERLYVELKALVEQVEKDMGGEKILRKAA